MTREVTVIHLAAPGPALMIQSSELGQVPKLCFLSIADSIPLEGNEAPRCGSYCYCQPGFRWRWSWKKISLNHHLKYFCALFKTYLIPSWNFWTCYQSLVGVLDSSVPCAVAFQGTIYLSQDVVDHTADTNKCLWLLEKRQHFIATHMLDLSKKKSFRSNWEICPWPGESKDDSKPFILLLKPWLGSILYWVNVSHIIMANIWHRKVIWFPGVFLG